VDSKAPADAALPSPQGKQLIQQWLDAEVTQFVWGVGKGWKTRMNAVLRA